MNIHTHTILKSQSKSNTYHLSFNATSQFFQHLVFKTWMGETRQIQWDIPQTDLHHGSIEVRSRGWNGNVGIIGTQWWRSYHFVLQGCWKWRGWWGRHDDGVVGVGLNESWSVWWCGETGSYGNDGINVIVCCRCRRRWCCCIGYQHHGWRRWYSVVMMVLGWFRRRVGFSSVTHFFDGYLSLIDTCELLGTILFLCFILFQWIHIGQRVVMRGVFWSECCQWWRVVWTGAVAILVHVFKCFMWNFRHIGFKWRG